MQPFKDYADQLVLLGYTPIPIRPGEKRPVPHHWQDAYLHPEQMLDYRDTMPAASVGILTRGLCVVDIDVYDREIVRAVLAWIRENIDPNPILRVGRSPKVAIFFRAPEGETPPKRTSAAWRSPDGRVHRIEILGAGQQIVVHGTHPDTGQPYLWPNGDLCAREVAIEELPVLHDQQAHDLLGVLDTLGAERGYQVVSDARTGEVDEVDPRDPVPGVTLDHARDALRYYRNIDRDYDSWLEVGMALHHQFEGSREAFQVWRDWSLQSSKASADDSYDWKRWTSFQTDRPGAVTMGTLLFRAETEGWPRPAELPARFAAEPATADDFPELAAGDDEGGIDEEDETEDEGEKGLAALPEGFTTLPADFDPASIPCRDWIVPGRLLRGHVTLTVGPPGVAKSTIELARCIAVATGRPILDEIPRVVGPVVYVNNEDPPDEILRRISAICIAHGIPYRELHRRLIVCSGYGKPLRIAQAFTDRSSGLRVVRPTQGATRLRDLARQVEAVLIYADPAVSLADGLEENSNNDAEGLMNVLRALATQAETAVSVTHHTHKTGADSEAHAGNMETARGASALVGAVRMGFTIARMSRQRADKLGIPWETARRLVRFDDAKSNYSLPDADALWICLESVTLPNGESVGSPRVTTLEEHMPDPGQITAEGAQQNAYRQMLVQLFLPELAAGGSYYEGSLKAVTERWMGHADVGERTAREMLRRLLPEGDQSAAVSIEHDGRWFQVWRAVEGEGRGARHRVFIQAVDPEADDWVSDEEAE